LLFHPNLSIALFGISLYLGYIKPTISQSIDSTVEIAMADVKPDIKPDVKQIELTIKNQDGHAMKFKVSELL
jgi:hypothetical protein